jgi:hypothetical protein
MATPGLTKPGVLICKQTPARRHLVHMRMLTRCTIAIAAAAVVGTLSVGADAWARGGGGRGNAHGMSWGGKGMMGGKSGHGRHFPHQAHNGKHNNGHGKHDDKNNNMGMWQRGRDGKNFRREWQAGGGGGGVGGGGYGGGGSVGDFCQGTLCQGVWYQVTDSPKRSRDDQPVDK